MDLTSDKTSIGASCSNSPMARRPSGRTVQQTSRRISTHGWPEGHRRTRISTRRRWSRFNSLLFEERYVRPVRWCSQISTHRRLEGRRRDPLLTRSDRVVLFQLTVARRSRDTGRSRRAWPTETPFQLTSKPSSTGDAVGEWHPISFQLTSHTGEDEATVSPRSRRTSPAVRLLGCQEARPSYPEGTRSRKSRVGGWLRIDQQT